MGVADFLQLFFDSIKLLAGGITRIGLNHRGVRTRNLARSGSHFVRDLEHDLATHFLHHFAADLFRSVLVHRIHETLQEDNRDRFDLFIDDQTARPFTHFVFINRNHRGSEHVDPLGHTPRELRRHQGDSMLSVLHVGDLAPLRTDKGLLPAPLRDDVLKTLRGQNTGLVTVHIDHGIEHRSTRINRGLDIGAEVRAFVLGNAHVFKGFPKRLHITDALILRRGRGLADDALPFFIDDDDVGHGAACITRNEVARHRTPALLRSENWSH